MPRSKPATKKTPEKTSANVNVFVPCGTVRAAEILKAAVLAARDEIPMAAINVTPKVVSASDVTTNGSGEEGRNYTVTITWTPRPTRASTAEEEDEAPATVDKVLDALEPLTPSMIAEASESAAEA
jgi:hypothetical protein